MLSATEKLYIEELVQGELLGIIGHDSKFRLLSDNQKKIAIKFHEELILKLNKDMK